MISTINGQARCNVQISNVIPGFKAVIAAAINSGNATRVCRQYDPMCNITFADQWQTSVYIADLAGYNDGMQLSSEYPDVTQYLDILQHSFIVFVYFPLHALHSSLLS